MSDTEKEKKDNFKLDPYLESPKIFNLEMPLYHNFDLSVGTVAEKIYNYLSYNDTIDAYCIWCEKESVFNITKKIFGFPDSSRSEFSGFQAWLKRGDMFDRIIYQCTREKDHSYYIYYLKEGMLFTKIGQWPSSADLQIPQAEKYRKILGEDQYKEFIRGIGIAAYGVGIGSFVYLRRIFENLIEEARVKAQDSINNFPDDEYQESKMDKKIKILKDYLPEFLVENRILYSILSKGIHELSEKECLRYFEPVKIGIEQILDEKIVQKEKLEKAAKAREAIQKVHRELTR